MNTFSGLRQALGNSLDEFTQALAAYLPNLIIALLLLALGWLLARLVRALILRFGSGIDHLSARLRGHAGPMPLPLNHPASTFIARIAYWVVIVFFLAAAVEPLGLPGLSEWINQLILYLPRVLIAGLIVLIGGVLGGIAHDLMQAAAQARGMASSEALAVVAQGLIIAFAAVLGVGQLGLDITLLVNLVTLTVGAVLGALGLAFGLGARHQVSQILASHQLRKIYREGQRVRVGEVEGEILELTTTAVMIDTGEGRAMVPARLFLEQVSVLMSSGAEHD